MKLITPSKLAVLMAMSALFFGGVGLYLSSLSNLEGHQETVTQILAQNLADAEFLAQEQTGQPLPVEYRNGQLFRGQKLLDEGIVPMNFFSRYPRCEFGVVVDGQSFTVEVGCSRSTSSTKAAYYAGGVFSPNKTGKRLNGLLNACRSGGVYLRDSKSCWINRIGSCAQPMTDISDIDSSFEYVENSAECI